MIVQHGSTETDAVVRIHNLTWQVGYWQGGQGVSEPAIQVVREFSLRLFGSPADSMPGQQ